LRVVAAEAIKDPVLNDWCATTQRIRFFVGMKQLAKPLQRISVRLTSMVTQINLANTLTLFWMEPASLRISILNPNAVYISPALCDEGDSDDSGTPTTGDPTEGTPGPDTYICTTRSQEKCVLYNWVTTPSIEPFKDCWVDPNLANEIQPCVTANDAMGAKTACEGKCVKHKMDVDTNVAMYNTMNSGDDYQVIAPPIDCAMDGSPSGDAPILLTNSYQCAQESTPLVAWGGNTVFTGFHSTAALSTLDGGSTGYSDIIGYIGYSVTNCAGGMCDVTIDAIETVKSDINGIFSDAAGSQTFYIVENFDLHLVQPVLGTLYQSRGTIVFPTSPFVGVADSTDYSIDGLSLGGWQTTQVLTQATGSLSSAGVLTLNLTLNFDGGVFTVSMTTI
jgi:hypothetical protein